MNDLADQGMLSENQIRAIEGKLIDADDAITRGTASYADAIKFNNAKRAAQGRLTKEAAALSEVPATAEEFASGKIALMKETGKDLVEFTSKGIDMLLSDKPMRLAVRGVAALHGMSEMEKRTVFDHVSEELRALQGNPEYFIERMGSLLDRGAAWDPQGADLAGQKAANAVYYLASQLPRVDKSLYGAHVPPPLSGVEEWLEKYVAYYDPISVAYAALEGRVTKAMIDSVRITNPAIYAELQSIVAEQLTKVPAINANPQAVAGASLFLGGLDPIYGGDFIYQLQSGYTQTTTQDQVISGPRPRGQIRNSGSQRQLTSSQRQQTY
jgi:hypothetical protein